MQRDWWVSVIQWTVWGVVMTIVMGWVAKSRMKPRPEVDATILRHPKSTLIIGLLTFVFFAGIAVISNTVGKNKTTSNWTTVLFLFFAGMALAMIADYYLARHRLSSEGLQYGKLFGRRGFVRWVDVRSITYAPIMKWFKLRTESGATVRLSAMLMGLPVFAQHVLTHVRAERIDEPTRSLLRETANGNPPSVWK